MNNRELELFYQKYYQSLYLYAFSLTKNKADAEDLVMNALVKALLSFDKGELKPWLYTVLKNDYYNLLKKRKKIIGEDKIHLDWIQDGNDFIENFIKEERKRWLYKEIYALPEKEREIMLLSIHSEFTDQKISELVNLSATNVKTIRFRVKQKLIKKSEELL